MGPPNRPLLLAAGIVFQTWSEEHLAFLLR
jgi:hypothetical protein